MTSSTFPTWIPAYIALGSNLNDPAKQIRQAVQRLKALPDSRLVLQSSLYRSAPLGPQDQPDFINAVVGMLTKRDAPTLLTELQGIEQRMGRGHLDVW